MFWLRWIADLDPICGQLTIAFRQPRSFLLRCVRQHRFVDLCRNAVHRSIVFHQSPWLISRLY